MRIASRWLVVCAVAVLMVVPAQAQRRRAVGKSPALIASTPCHTFGLVRQGLKASYLSTTNNGGSATYTITYLSDTGTQTKTTQVVSTPQGNADAVTTLDAVGVGPLRGVKHIDLTTTITVPVVGKLTTEVDVDFVPALVLGPSDGWCVGKTWDVAPVTETVVTKAPFATPVTTIVTTVGGTGEVLAVGESVTVPGGTFNTVKYRGVTVADNNVQPTITWVSMPDAIVVKQDTFDAVTGVQTSATQLTNLQ
jgi:hypothetical protein